MKYSVTVEKKMYLTGAVDVDADSPDQAIAIVQARIESNELLMENVSWNDPQYEEGSFFATDDVD